MRELRRSVTDLTRFPWKKVITAPFPKVHLLLAPSWTGALAQTHPISSILVSGCLVYDPSGVASAQVGIAIDSPDQDLLAEIGAWVGYYGRFELSLNPNQVIHHVQGSSVAAWIGRELPRGVRFEGEDMLIRSVDVSR